MIIYSASILFYAGNITNNVPACSTSNSHSSIDSFIDWCVSEVQQNKMFNYSNVDISVIATQINDDGTLRKTEQKIITFKNYKY